MNEIINLINLDTLSTNKKLTTSETYILDFINTSPDFFSNHKIATIAKAINVSTSSITRLVKKLGFESLKHLQLHILYKRTYMNDNFEIVDSVDLKSNLQNVKTYHLYSIEQTLNTLDLNASLKLVNDLIDANKIMIYGIGRSHLISQDFAFNLQKIGLKIIANEDFYQQLVNIATLNEKDHILIFSKNGNSREIQLMIELAHKKRIPISVLTSNMDFENADKLKNIVSFVTHEQKDRVSEASSKLAQLIVSDFLFLQVYQKLGFNKESDSTIEIIKEWSQKD